VIRVTQTRFLAGDVCQAQELTIAFAVTSALGASPVAEDQAGLTVR
jgi:hypothetical protein